MASSNMVTKIVRFEAAHRLLGYKGPCANIHGHSYKCEVSIVGKVNLPEGFVIDFSKLKEAIDIAILQDYDHQLFLNIDDPLAKILSGTTRIQLCIGNPTAESMSEDIAGKVIGVLNRLLPEEDFKRLYSIIVKLWETETSYVTYSRDF